MQHENQSSTLDISAEIRKSRRSQKSDKRTIIDAFENRFSKHLKKEMNIYQILSDACQ